MQAIYKKKVEKIVNQSTAASYFIKKITLSNDILKIDFYQSFAEYRKFNPAKNKVAPTGKDEFLDWFNYNETDNTIHLNTVYKTFYKISFSVLSKVKFVKQIHFNLPISKTNEKYEAMVDYIILKRIIENEDFEWIKVSENKN
ncbi:hypothetical protein WAF17_21070 [Bernardetia sp. ABR2-2B]|uniref:hypothetical protein n=1 Tax=Bernardetia sp. ABR2-2B TaxID=3127472 RepID=UPI0030CAE8FA